MKVLSQGFNEYDLIHEDPEEYGISIKIILRNGTVLRIYEREPGILELNSDEVLHIEPRATNVVHIRLDHDSFESGK